MEVQSSFDVPAARAYNNVRQEFIRALIQSVRPETGLKSALDVGCGVGYFSQFLLSLGLNVVALDGREENTTEARRRHPQITFVTRNAEDIALPEIGVFDLVLCVGLLYHLENPFRTIRNLRAMTGKLLALESMCIPGSEAIMNLLDENDGENQGLNCVAFYPTESCLVKMLYRAGFSYVYTFAHLPADDQFRNTLWRKKSRTFMAASNNELIAPNLLLVPEPHRLPFGNENPWETVLSRFASMRDRSFWMTKVSQMRAMMLERMKSLRRTVEVSSSNGTARTK